MEIYFDDTLLNEDYYTSLSVSNILFENTPFQLGRTPSIQYTLSLYKDAVENTPNNVVIKENGEIIANLVVDSITINDDDTITYKLTDKMVELEFYYDASEIFVDDSTTLFNIATDICNRVGIELGTNNFRGKNKTISWYDNTITARQYIGYIAELNGGYAQIGKDGKLYFLKHKTQSKATISIDECADFTIGERHEIGRVVYEFDTLKYEFGNGETLYLDNTNPFITEESEVEGIYNDISGFVFFAFKTSGCPIDFNINAGEIITFDDGENEYPIIAQYDLTYYGCWIGGYSLEISTEKQTETQVIGTEKKVKSLKVLVDRDANLIQQNIERIDTVDNTTKNLSTLIQQYADSIISTIAEKYVSIDNIETYKKEISTQFEQTSSNFQMLFRTLTEQVKDVDGQVSQNYNELIKYIRFVNGNIVLGEVGNEITLQLSNNRLSFLQNGVEVAYMSNNTLYIIDGNFLKSLRIGSFAYIPRSNGSLDFKFVGGA